VSDGRFSTWANSALEIGHTLDVMVPAGSFHLAFAAAPRNHYVAFAGVGDHPGPVSAEDHPVDRARQRFTLFYGNRDAASIIFLEELAALKDRFLSRLRVPSRAGAGRRRNRHLQWPARPREMRAAARPDDQGAGDRGFFICGPGPMMDAAESALLERGCRRTGF